MSETVMVIRLASSLRKTSEWMTPGKEQRSEVHTLAADEPLAQLADQPGAKNVHLLLPPEGLIFRELTLPKAKYKLTPQTIHWLTEETLPDSAIVYHWILIQQCDMTAHVVGIAVETLREHLDRLHAAGLNVTQVLPDGCYLPWEPQSWTLINQENSWLTRSEEHAFNELDENWLRHLLPQFQPETLCSYGDLPAGIALPPSVTRHGQTSPLTLYVPDAQTQRYNLLQGAFLPQPALTRGGKWLPRLAAVSVAFAIASFIVSRGYAFWQLQQTEALLTQQMQDTWHSYFPAIQRTDNYHFYFALQLKQQYPAAVPLLHQLETVLQAQPDIRLTAMRYSQQKKSLDLTVAASSEAEVDRFCQTLAPWLPLEKSRNDAVWTLRSKAHD
ncbi:type II secretion system protein GspL [Superficieibacter sp.]|uniref:type II secretion system protein GspL n=1 Tax=Superficieibacter sp. TaxID=2303322 RepID=UPI0028A70DAF|nr:type II secretion system protein GspL [Superficieibacter sp.]